MENFQTIAKYFHEIRNNSNLDNHYNYVTGSEITSFSTKEFFSHVDSLIANFQKIGIKKGSYVGLIADSSPYWLMTDAALATIGAVSVPMFSNISLENLDFQIKDSKLKYIIIEGQQRWAKIGKVIGKVENVITKDISDINKERGNLFNFADMLKPSSQNADIEKLVADVKPDDMLTVIYTSGTTGKPKGVMLTHKNLVAQVKGAQDFFRHEDGSKLFSYLPFAHIFERMIMYFYQGDNCPIYINDKVENIINNLKIVQPNAMTTVPRLLEKIYATINEKAIAANGFKGWLLKKAVKYAKNNKDAGMHNLWGKILDGLVFKKMRESVGGQMSHMVSGGAALDQNICRFMFNIGIPIFQGYGLTESSPVISSNCPGHNKVGTVGRAFKGTNVKISSTQEIMVKSDSVMKGYLNSRVKTDETIKEGWLATGDLGEIDKDGYLIIKGRAKEMYKTATGKYVVPVPIEQQINDHTAIDISMVIADGKKYATCLVFLSEGTKDSPKLQQELDSHIKIVNSHLNKWEKIVKFVIADKPATVETGELTPSLKLARHIVEDKYKDKIDSMYKI